MVSFLFGFGFGLFIGLLYSYLRENKEQRNIRKRFEKDLIK